MVQYSNTGFGSLTPVFIQRKIQLKLLRYSIRQVVSGSEVTMGSEGYGHIADVMAYQFRRFVLSHTPLSHVEEWPDGIVEMLHARLPQWVLHRWPVRYKQWRVDVRLIFPKANVQVPRGFGDTYTVSMLDYAEAAKAKKYERENDYPEHLGTPTVHIIKRYRTTTNRDADWDEVPE